MDAMLNRIIEKSTGRKHKSMEEVKKSRQSARYHVNRLLFVNLHVVSMALSKY